MMLFQRWLAGGASRLLAVEHSPETGFAAGGAVLFAGFSHPMSDVDYFMSRLARQLARNGIFVAQVDSRGHGDSYGDLADVTLDTLRNDINLAVRHYETVSPDPLLVIGRGLTATLALEQLGSRDRVAVGAVCPYRLSMDTLALALRHHGESNAVDALAVFPGNDYVTLSDFAEASIALLNALGTVPYNLHGSRLSRELLEGLAEFDADAVLRASHQDRNLLIEDAFLRRPVWQMEQILKLTRWASDFVLRR